jgi:hypothetical protein
VSRPGGRAGPLAYRLGGRDMPRISKDTKGKDTIYMYTHTKEKREQWKRPATILSLSCSGEAGRHKPTYLFPASAVNYWGDQISSSNNFSFSEKIVLPSRWMIFFPSSVPIPKILRDSNCDDVPYVTLYHSLSPIPNTLCRCITFIHRWGHRVRPRSPVPVDRGGPPVV